MARTEGVLVIYASEINWIDKMKDLLINKVDYFEEVINDDPQGYQ